MIIIPMAGLSSRFFEAGFKKPKYMLEAHGKSLFEYSVNSFKNYFSDETFLFIVRNEFDTPNFVKNKATLLGIRNFYIEILDQETRGQAETVAIGLEKLSSKGVNYNEAITIFNIDTFRPGYQHPAILEPCDGYLEVFKGNGTNWSFAKPESTNSNKVIQTAEKTAISELCSTGLYYFSKKDLFLDSFLEYQKKPKHQWEKNELYIAPLYNIIIKNGLIVKYNLIDEHDVIFCGVPDEYQILLDAEQKIIDKISYE